jgi:hypothetical protein
MGQGHFRCGTGQRLLELNRAFSIVGGMATVPGGFIAGVIHDSDATDIDAWRIDIVAR